VVARAFGREEVAIERAAITVIESALVVVCVVGVVESLACTTNEYAPGAVGVPLRAPFDARVSPGGSDPEEMLQV
jgi:hypothetical protein